MDLKGIIGSLLPTQLRAKESIQKRDRIKSDSATDRDGNGQQAYDQGKQRGPMNEEEIEAAMQHLKGLAVVKDSGLHVELTLINGKNFVLLKDPTGKILRRISEAELGSLITAKDRDKGQLLSKAV
jgi:hypothetical protein